MLIKQYQKLWRYNNWAWSHLLESVQKLPDEEFKKEHPFFWKSIHTTLAHTVAAEKLWLERLKGNNPDRLLDAKNLPTLNSILELRHQMQEQWMAYLNSLSSERVNGQISYRSTEGIMQHNKVADIIQHVANHSTEHRSQLTPILFQLNVPTDPLDFIFYCLLVESD